MSHTKNIFYSLLFVHLLSVASVKAEGASIEQPFDAAVKNAMYISGSVGITAGLSTGYFLFSDRYKKARQSLPGYFAYQKYKKANRFYKYWNYGEIIGKVVVTLLGGFFGFTITKNIFQPFLKSVSIFREKNDQLEQKINLLTTHHEETLRELKQKSTHDQKKFLEITTTYEENAKALIEEIYRRYNELDILFQKGKSDSVNRIQQFIACNQKVDKQIKGVQEMCIRIVAAEQKANIACAYLNNVLRESEDTICKIAREEAIRIINKSNGAETV